MRDGRWSFFHDRIFRFETFVDLKKIFTYFGYLQMVRNLLESNKSWELRYCSEKFRPMFCSLKFQFTYGAFLWRNHQVTIISYYKIIKNTKKIVSTEVVVSWELSEKPKHKHRDTDLDESLMLFFYSWNKIIFIFTCNKFETC